MTGKELLEKVRSIKTIQDIHWQVIGDVLAPEEVKVIVVTDKETFEVSYPSSEEDDDDDDEFIQNAAMAFIINKFMELISDDFRTSAYDELYKAVNHARNHL